MTTPVKPQSGNPHGEVLEEIELREPSMSRVILHNDDYTTMEFVVQILCTVFRKRPAEATRIMMAVHEKGRCECGVYPTEVAETKVSIVHGQARAAGYPLRCSLEEV